MAAAAQAYEERASGAKARLERLAEAVRQRRSRRSSSRSEDGDR